MDSIISTFHIDWKIIIAQAINFAVVFTVLYIFAIKPLAKLMRERGEKISKGIDDAKSNAVLLEKTEAEYDQALAKAHAEANKIFQEGKREAEAKKAALMEEARAEVTNMVANGKKMLEAEKIKMVEDAKREVSALALLAAEKLMSGKTEGYNEKATKELNQI